MAVKKVTKSMKRGDRAQASVKANLEAVKGASPAKARMNLGLSPESPPVKKGVRKITIPAAIPGSEPDTRSHEPKTYRVGDRVWYRAETWYVEADRGGNFVSIRDWPRTGAEDAGSVPKVVVQSVHRVTLRKNDVIPAGNGPLKSEAEENYKAWKKDRRGRMVQETTLFTDKDLTTKPEKRGKKHVREVKPHDPNLIPLKKICGDVNVDPKLARRLLRAEKSIPRPEGRWEFDPKDLERIRKVITQPIK